MLENNMVGPKLGAGGMVQATGGRVSASWAVFSESAGAVGMDDYHKLAALLLVTAAGARNCARSETFYVSKTSSALDTVWVFTKPWNLLFAQRNEGKTRAGEGKRKKTDPRVLVEKGLEKCIGLDLSGVSGCVVL